jgi:hypothetical protein
MFVESHGDWENLMSVQLEPEPPNPPRRGLRKGLYLIPSMFTAANIGMGFFSVMSSLRAFQLLAGPSPELATQHFDNALSRLVLQCSLTY